MDPITKVKLGPIPLPYVIVIALLPLWIFFSVGESSLLYSISVIVTIILKGSLLSRWAFYRYAPFRLKLIPVIGVIVLEVYIIGEALQISSLPLVVLVPISNAVGFGVFQLHLDSGEEGKRSSQVIGIFSRSSADEYNWLKDALRTAGNVVPFYISNSNYREFRDQVSKCSLAILYHSKTRGRVNITDVTDSLYDEEVQHMSQVLGRENVLVVVDDLDDSSDGARNNILYSQTTIRDKTRDLFLFTREEKRDEERIREKLQPILNTATQKPTSQLIGDVTWTLILCVPWLHYYVDVYHGIVLILSNMEGSLLICNFLLPHSQSGTVLPLTYPIDRPKRALRSTKKGSAQAGIVLLVVIVLELVAAAWYYSSMKLILLVVQSLTPVLYAVLSLSSSSFSAAPKDRR